MNSCVINFWVADNNFIRCSTERDGQKLPLECDLNSLGVDCHLDHLRFIYFDNAGALPANCSVITRADAPDMFTVDCSGVDFSVNNSGFPTLAPEQYALGFTHSLYFLPVIFAIFLIGCVRRSIGL